MGICAGQRSLRQLGPTAGQVAVWCVISMDTPRIATSVVGMEVASHATITVG